MILSSWENDLQVQAKLISIGPSKIEVMNPSNVILIK
jgi:hypothetical protein